VLEEGFAIIHQTNDTESLVGRKIQNYTLMEKLGEGGMGTVYLAHDGQLDREVALKFISSDYFDSDLLKKRLIREAQAAARLDHPNICPIYAIEEVDDLNFIVMPRIPGKTLAHLITHGQRFSEQEIISIIEQIAEAIAAAHTQGIIHRDIKPANIMRNSAGHIQVLDFGLAKLIDLPGHPGGGNLAENSTGLVFGTVSYMSPEQLRNERVDFRTDIYSLGVLMYEMCSLKKPFVQQNPVDIISAVLNQVVDFSVLDSTSYVSLKPIIRKCLERDPSDRYTSMDEFMLALGAVQQGAPSKTRLRVVSAGKWIFIALLVLLFALGAGVYWNSRSAPLRRVAVLPLFNNTGDPSLDYLGPGISEGLMNRLARQTSRGDLALKPLTAVAAYRDSDLDVASTVRELNIDFLVKGTIARVNGELIATVNSFDNEHLEGVWTSLDAFEADDLLTLEQTLADRIITSLQIPAQSSSSSSMIQESGEAYRNYLIGQYFWSKRDSENIQKAILYFNRAIEIDPSYAKAYAGLANSYVLQSLSAYGAVPIQEAMIKAKAAAKQAIEIDPENCEAHTALGVVLMKYDWDWQNAGSELQKAVNKNPDYAPAHYWNSCLMAIMGRRDESIVEARKARELDPFSSQGAVNLARAYYYARHYAEALEILRHEQEAGDNELKIRYMIGLVLLQQHRYDEARDILNGIYQENKLFGSAALGFCYARMGKVNRARELISGLQKDPQNRTVPSLEIGMIYAGLNEKTKACQYLEGAFAEHNSALISFGVEPLYDGVRDATQCATFFAGLHLRPL
jgi:tetratricopeptide (TPR) repeat protein